MQNPNTTQPTPEQMKDAVTNIIHAGDDEAARALVGLVFALANVADEGTRLELAAAVAVRAYTRTAAFGDAVLALMQGNGSQFDTASAN